MLGCDEGDLMCGEGKSFIYCFFVITVKSVIGVIKRDEEDKV